MNFVAIDVETANADMSSICQIGLARFSGGAVIEEWSTLLNPEDYFDPTNVDIHGISEADVCDARTFPEVAREFTGLIDSSVCVCHTHFDRVSLKQAFAKYRLSEPDLIWLDSARVVRRAWEEFSWNGYGLANVCSVLGYQFEHHNALEDAKAAGHIVLAASEKVGLDIEGWLRRVGQPISLTSSISINKAGNPEGELYGEVVVFTGSLALPRKEAACLAASVGCDVMANVTKKTSLLVVGDQDITKLAGHSKSRKHRKAEALIAKGLTLRIIRESDFVQLVNHAQSVA